jgi:hypothetical protein
MDRLSLTRGECCRLGVELARRQNLASRRPPLFSRGIVGTTARLNSGFWPASHCGAVKTAGLRELIAMALALADVTLALRKRAIAA